MLNIPEVIKELFMQDGIRKNFRVHFPNGERADLVNKDIIEESVKFTESTCSQQTLRFGLTEASVIEFECVGVENIAGMTIECGIEIDVSSLSRDDRIAYGTKKTDVDFPVYYVPYGVFVVEQCKRQKDLARRKVVAYTREKQETLDILGGLRPNENIVISAEDYAQIIATKVDKMDAGGTTPSVIGYTNTMLSQGIGFLEIDSRMSPEMNRTTVEAEGFIYIVDVDFVPHENDSLAQELCGLILASLPAGDYTYLRYGVSPAVPGGYPYKAFSSVPQRVMELLAAMYPAAVNVEFEYESEIRIDTIPILIDRPGRVILDIDEVRMMYGVKGSPTSARIQVSKRRRWPGSSDARYTANLLINYEIHQTRYYIQGWPFQQEIQREGQMLSGVVAIKKTDGDKMSISPTGGYQQVGLGVYYSYDKAIGETDAANAVLEMFGSFGNIERDGYITIKKLSKENPQIITPSDTEDLWYEEGATKKIGRVSYTYEEAGEQYDGETTIDSSATGSYSLSQNKALELMEDRTQANIEKVIKNNFAPNVTDAFYVPVDLTMRGMPWLEDGDPIRIQNDGGDIDTYVLKRTLSGVQHLVDDIEAQGEV